MARGQNGGASTASSSNDSMRVGSNNRNEHKRADDPVAHRETLGSATESAAETSAKQRPAKKLRHKYWATSRIRSLVNSNRVV